MAKRKAKRSSGAKPQPKVNQRTGGRPASRLLPIAIIVASVLVLVVYAMWESLQPNQPGSGVTTTNQTTPIAPPMTGVEAKAIGTVEASKAKVATFKMEELSGTDCLENINAQLRLLGGIGKVRADYSNKLCEIEYDSTKVTEAKIIEAFNKADHPGKPTGEKIAAP